MHPLPPMDHFSITALMGAVPTGISGAGLGVQLQLASLIHLWLVWHLNRPWPSPTVSLQHTPGLLHVVPGQSLMHVAHSEATPAAPQSRFLAP